MTDTSKPSIAIVGGGIAGVTLAIGLIKRGIDTTVYEQAHSFAEIGAGIALGPNVARAMQVIDKQVNEAFAKVSTGNLSKDKADVWFDFCDGFDHQANDESQEKWLFDLKIAPGGGGVHRAHFLDELIKLIPSGSAHFNKHLDTYVQRDDGKIELHFHDNSVAVHDAVIGCDGIKSRVRALLVGEDDPKALPTYTHKYAYRGLIPMDKAVELLGDGVPQNSRMLFGPNGHILTFPIDHGKVLNVVAFRQDDGDWTEKRLTAPAHKDDVLRDYAGWHPRVTTMLKMLKEDLDRWAIFDLGSHPLETYCKGRVCVVGDAAHATSPHHGAGAGVCIEDSAVLSELLARAIEIANGGRASMQKSLEAAFTAYDQARRERTQWLVQSSRHSGNLYDWMDPDAGQDDKKILADLMPRCHRIWDWDLGSNIREALADLEGRLG